MQYDLRMCLFCADICYVLGKDGGLIPTIVNSVHT